MHCRLYGTIPAEVFTLPELDVLALDGNRFNGTLPATLSSASALTILEIGLNSLTGEPDSTLLSIQGARPATGPCLIAGTAMLGWCRLAAPRGRAT